MHAITQRSFIHRKQLWLWGTVFVINVGLAIWAELHLASARPLAGRLDDQEPESHILVTELAFEQTSWRIHHFLPIFTLGASYNKFVDNHPGAESMDWRGNYYYTSTPPLTFDLPYFFSKLTGGPPTLFKLRSYNLVLQYAAAGALGWLVFLCGRSSGVEKNLCLITGAVASIIYITAPESLHSHTISLWAQQFFCVLLVIQLIVYLFRPSLWLLGLMAFVGCLADWTPYLANFSMAAIALWSYFKSRDRRALHIAIALAVGVLLAGICMMFWFHTEFSLLSYITDLRVRRHARSQGGLRDLQYFVPAYINSLGLFTIICAVVLLQRPWTTQFSNVLRKRQPIFPAVNPFLLCIAIFCISLIENILMKVHALEYSYDRLKGVQLIALVIAWAALRSFRSARTILAMCLAVGYISVLTFWIKFDTPLGYCYTRRSEQELLGAIIARTAGENPAFFNGDIRGSEVFYAGRNIVEFDHAEGRQLTDEARQWCLTHSYKSGTVYQISGSYPYPLPNEMPRIIYIQQVHTDGAVIMLQNIRLDEKPGEYHAPVNAYSWTLEPIVK